MKITCNIQEGIIDINYAGLGISIDREQILNSAEEFINILKVLPFPEDVKKDMIPDLETVNEYLPIFRKFSESLKYNDCSASIVINDDGTINVHQTEVHTLIDLPKIISAFIEFQELTDRKREENRLKYEEQESHWSDLRDSKEEAEEELESTDQSMADMANNKLVFLERPKFYQVCSKMQVSTIRALKHMEKHEGLHFTPVQLLSSEALSLLCDSFGYEAVIKFSDDYNGNPDNDIWVINIEPGSDLYDLKMHLEQRDVINDYASGMLSRLIHEGYNSEPYKEGKKLPEVDQQILDLINSSTNKFHLQFGEEEL